MKALLHTLSSSLRATGEREAGSGDNALLYLKTVEGLFTLPLEKESLEMDLSEYDPELEVRS